MYLTNPFIIVLKSLKKEAYAFLALSLAAIVLTACAQSAVTGMPSPQPTAIPTAQPSPMPGATPTGDNTTSVVLAAKTLLAEKAKTNMDAIQLVDIQPVQWPDGCLGVTQAGVMCAMHVVDGYRITLSINSLNYEAHGNLDGSQIVFVLGPVLNSAGLSYSIGNEDECQTYLFTQNQDAAFGPCYGTLKKIPYVEKSRISELDHYIQTYQSFSLTSPRAYLNFFGKGTTQGSEFEQRSIDAWTQIASDEILTGRSSAAAGLVFGWHRAGGLAGFCDDLSVYTTGVANATTCKNGKANDLGSTWLTGQQLTQLYQWLDDLNKFEYAPNSQATADALTLQLVFAGKGSMAATQRDMQAIETFAERLYAQIGGPQVSPDTSAAEKVVETFLTNLKADPSGKSSLNDLSSALQADIQSGDLLPDLMGIQNTYASFAISSAQPVAGMEQVLVDATLNFVSPIHRSFVLVLENGAWRISTFVVHALPPMTPEDDFLAADQVILEYVQALQSKNAANAWGLLSSQAQGRTPQAGLEKEAQGLKTVSAAAITLNQKGTDQLTYTVIFWASLAQNFAPGWLEGKNTRSFTLVKTGANWQVDQILSAN